MIYYTTSSLATCHYIKLASYLILSKKRKMVKFNATLLCVIQTFHFIISNPPETKTWLRLYNKRLKKSQVHRAECRDIMETHTFLEKCVMHTNPLTCITYLTSVY